MSALSVYIGQAECVLDEMPPQWSSHSLISGAASLPVIFTSSLSSLLWKLTHVTAFSEPVHCHMAVSFVFTFKQ